MIYGIDVSYHQEVIDWPKVKAGGVVFAIIKATEGTGYTDPKFADNIKGCIDAGIVPGTYHFFSPKLDPIAQAENYLNAMAKTIPASAKTLPPCLDLEVSGGLSRAAIKDAVKSIMEKISTPARPAMIYTSPGFWATYLPVPALLNYKWTEGDVDWARNYPLWQAQYTNFWPTIIYPWTGWAFWQYSSAARVSGIKTKCDVNRFDGTMEELKAMTA